MNINKRVAFTLGILFLFHYIFGIFSSVPALENSDYLQKLSSIETQVLIAVFCQAAMAIVYVWMSVLFYPLLKRYNKTLAIGYFGFRIIGAAFLFAGIASLLLLLWLSQSYIVASTSDISYFTIIAEILRRGRDILNHVAMILPWSIGGIILYYGLSKVSLIPNWLSKWGILGSAFTLIATLLLMLNVIELTQPIYFILNTPIALGDLILGILLIKKGLSTKRKEMPDYDFS